MRWQRCSLGRPGVQIGCVSFFAPYRFLLIAFLSFRIPFSTRFPIVITISSPLIFLPIVISSHCKPDAAFVISHLRTTSPFCFHGTSYYYTGAQSHAVAPFHLSCVHPLFMNLSPVLRSYGSGLICFATIALVPWLPDVPCSFGLPETTVSLSD